MVGRLEASWLIVSPPCHGNWFIIGQLSHFIQKGMEATGLEDRYRAAVDSQVSGFPQIGQLAGKGFLAHSQFGGKRELGLGEMNCVRNRIANRRTTREEPMQNPRSHILSPKARDRVGHGMDPHAQRDEHPKAEIRIAFQQGEKWNPGNPMHHAIHYGAGISGINPGGKERSLRKTFSRMEYPDHAFLTLSGDSVDIYRPGMKDIEADGFSPLAEDHRPASKPAGHGDFSKRGLLFE